VARRSRFAAAREKAGYSQATFAEAVGVTRNTVANWEEGATRPYPKHRHRMSEALGVTFPELADLLIPDGLPAGLSPVPVVAADWDEQHAGRLAAAAVSGESQPITPELAPRLVHEWLVVEPPQNVELRAGRRIGASLVERVAGRVDQLRHLDDFVAGTDLDAAMSREVAATATLVRESTYADKVGRRLLAVLGELCQLAGWVAIDAGRHRLACHCFATGIAAAHAAGDRPLAGQLASTLAYHLANTGEPRDAVLLAQSALTGSRAATTATTTALFLERLAWAHARAGERPQTERTLAAVEDAYADRKPDEDPAWTYWLTPEEVDVMAGRCYVELRLPHRARPLLERALPSYGGDRPREAALYTSWLAEAHLQAGDVDQAADLARRVLDLAALTASVRTDDRARHLRRLLHRHRGTASVADFEDRYRALP
jgi:transcriptional regulator with XRE-family HTH domain